MSGGIWIGAFCVSLAAAARADDSLWKLAFEDHFDRREAGDDWEFGNQAGRIIDGRLYIDSKRSRAVINRAFAPDVRVEFVAEINPDAPPCDISVGLGCGKNTPYSYLMQFGGQNNRVNAIHGLVVDNHPPFLIEYGRKYHCVATKEGRRLTYTVNGTRLVETAVQEAVGGPGFDRVALITWSGMFVDDVKVFERTTPAEGGPVLLAAMPDFGFTWTNRRLSFSGQASPQVQQAIAAYNQGRYAEALRLLDRAPRDAAVSVVAFAYVVGDVGYAETDADRQRLAEWAESIARLNPQDSKARDFASAARWFSGISIRSRDRRACIRLTGLGTANNPFYYKARFYLTRYQMASAKEGAHVEAQKRAVAEFDELRKIWPEHPSLREFTGEKIPWGQELIHVESDGPEWARFLQESFARQQTILNWWATHRQYPDGALGGGWGDDVEILRDWVPVACISTAGEPAVSMIEKLAQGVWDHVLKDGYDPTIGDIEHSAEPSCDSLPTMLLLRYGDPRWVEYNLRSAKTVREKFMAVSERGHLQFKSSVFGTNGVHTGIGAGGDTGYHARALRHHIWLAWYGVPEARDQFLAWCETWRDATMRQIGTKPPGFPPPSIFWPSGTIDPPTGKPWYDDRSNYYGFPGLPNMVFHSFLTACFLSGERRFLDPIDTMMQMSTLGPLRTGRSDLPPDHIDNLLASVAHMSDPELSAVYRELTGLRIYDEYTLRRCTATQRYRVNYDLAAYARSFQGLAERLRYNWTQHTVEVIQTDRAGLAGSHEVFGAYTGGVRDFRDSGTPTMGLTWETPDLNFAAMVTENTPDRLRVRIYSFNTTPTRMGLRPWRLLPGIYVLNAGEPVPGERPVQQRYTWGTPVEIKHLHRGTPVYVEVPARKEWVVDLRLRQAIPRPLQLADLAIGPHDVRLDAGRLHATVHNIGGDASGAFNVALEVRDAGRWSPVKRVQIDGLPAITGLEPVRKELAFDLDAATRGRDCRVVVDPDQQVDELYELNNIQTLVDRREP